MEKKELIEEMIKGVSMALESIEVIKNFTEDKPMLNTLNNQRKKYTAVLKELQNQASEEGLETKGVSVKDKAMLWSGSFFNTFRDSSASKIAEIMMQGTHLGVISLTKAVNKFPEDSEEADKLLEIYKTNIENLKVYL